MEHDCISRRISSQELCASQANTSLMKSKSPKALDALCAENNKIPGIIFRISYWTAEIYGFGRHIREYACYPKWLPLCINTDHGPGFRDTPLPSELSSSAPVQFYHAPSRVKSWPTFSGKACYCLFSPYVFFRRKAGIVQSAMAKGTIAFPAHTTSSIDDVSNIQHYIEQLKALPDVYQPVSICLHVSDICKGLHREFSDNGFEVFSAGTVQDERFAENFYQIIRNFKYATSNIGGGYLYYCVEMGLPFFLYGNEPNYINRGDQNIENGQYTSYKQHSAYQEMEALFSRPVLEITPAQVEFVGTGLGLRDGISRTAMSLILYGTLLKCIFSLRWLKYLASRMNSK